MADMKGQNRALSKYAYLLASEYSSNCVFISHKKEDTEAAKAIGDFLMNVMGVDIYLDIYDEELQEAADVDNDKKIVEMIERGINTSSHLLCLISDKTKLSWWVPYEIAIAKCGKKRIASLKLNTTEDIPSFLKIEEVLWTIQDFLEYVRKFSLRHVWMGAEVNFEQDVIENLKPYIDE